MAEAKLETFEQLGNGDLQAASDLEEGCKRRV
jgi:hypothetical protein